MKPTAAQLEDFLSECPVEEFSGTLYHGTPAQGALAALENGFYPQSHGELASGEYLSVSRNEEVLRLFSDGEPNTGFIFDAPKLKVLRLSELFAGLAAHETGMNIDDEIERDPSLKDRCDRLGYVTRWNSYGVDDEWLKAAVPLDVDGIMMPGFESNHQNAEAEIALTERGCTKLRDALSVVYIRGEEFENVAEATDALRALRDEEQWTSDDDYCLPLPTEEHTATAAPSMSGYG